MDLNLPIALRPLEATDLPFLGRLYATTRDREMAVVPWTENQKAQFLQQQFEAQHRHYQEHFADAQFAVICRDGRPIGRWYVLQDPDEIRLLDLALLPEFRGLGLGTQLMRELLKDAAASGRPVRLHVEACNPAFHFYQRLGFRPVANRGVYQLMEWTAGSAGCGP
jgi:ribosomal protein S18 acetylase RimI-like enzyme